MPVILGSDGRYYYIPDGTSGTVATQWYTTGTCSTLIPSYFPMTNACTAPTVYCNAIANPIALSQYTPTREFTAEEIAAQNARAEAARIEQEKKAAERKAADNRAKELLLEHLTPTQKETFEKNKWFVVEGGKTKRKYRINCQGRIAGNVTLLDNEKPVEHWCCHAEYSAMPNHDHWLAQKLMIEYDEESFARLANKSRVG